MLALTILFLTALVVLFAGLFKQRQLLQIISLFGLALAFVAAWPFGGDLLGEAQLFGKYDAMIRFDGFARAFSAIAILSTFFVVALSGFGFRYLLNTLGDHLGLILLSLCGVLCMVGFQNLTMLFIGIEILSIPLYVLAGSQRADLSSNEAALKYFLMGAFATGIFLFGTALIYGATGSFTVDIIAQGLTARGALGHIELIGIAMIIIGLSFKISAAPFHFWAPDVYEGSPNLVTAYMATVVKVAGLAAIYKLFSTAFLPALEQWAPVFAILSALSMTIGNFTAIFQTNFKRMMAYSGISHAGYLLMAVVAINTPGSQGALLLYLGSYVMATLIAFGVYMAVSEQQNNNQTFSAFEGLTETKPWLAAAMAFAMLTLAGIPPLAGFFGKYFLFTAAFQTYPWLVIVAIINSAISIYYYFKVIIAMYFTRSQAVREHIPTPAAYGLILGGAVLLILCMTILPSLLLGMGR
jgi:NADH-quinone oxidoreductase subunit N